MLFLQRNWKGRVKGRDYYDLIWYVAREVPVRLLHLEMRLRQSQAWDEEKSLRKSDLLTLLKNKISETDFELAKKDVVPFLQDSDAVTLWSQEFFESVVQKLTVI